MLMEMWRRLKVFFGIRAELYPDADDEPEIVPFAKRLRQLLRKPAIRVRWLLSKRLMKGRCADLLQQLMVDEMKCLVEQIQSREACDVLMHFGRRSRNERQDRLQGQSS